MCERGGIDDDDTARPTPQPRNPTPLQPRKRNYSTHPTASPSSFPRARPAAAPSCRPSSYHCASRSTTASKKSTPPPPPTFAAAAVVVVVAAVGPPGAAAPGVAVVAVGDAMMAGAGVAPLSVCVWRDAPLAWLCVFVWCVGMESTRGSSVSRSIDR